MTIRRPDDKDKPQLEAMMQEFYLVNQAQFIPPELKPFEDEPDQASGTRKYTEELLTDRKYHVFVAEEDGKLIGYAAAQIKKREDYTLNKEGFVEDLFVVENKRGQGVGRQLFKALADSLKQAGATHLGIDVYAVNHDAIEIYHHWGFIDSELVMRRQFD